MAIAFTALGSITFIPGFYVTKIALVIAARAVASLRLLRFFICNLPLANHEPPALAGAGHARRRYYAYKGYPGYSFDQIPQYND